ncbi:MAG TPA: VC0807 family protein [Thermomicrobiales bacterium]|nr:VC0807 family protein [Thermomicrobiales bacterium]
MQSSTIRQRTRPEDGRRRPFLLRPGTLWFAFDLLAPTALFYVMRWQGASLYLALLVPAAISAVSALISYRRDTNRQSFAPFMLALTLAAFAVALITGSDRFLLAKESILTALVGFWFLHSVWAERPLTYVFTRPLLESGYGRRVGIFGPLSWEQLWERDGRFRHIWRVSSVMWAVATLIDAVLRVVMAYTLPVNSVPAMQLAMFIVTGLVMQVVTNVYYARSGVWQLIREGGSADETTARIAPEAHTN